MEDRDRVQASALVNGDLVVAQPRMNLRVGFSGLRCRRICCSSAVGIRLSRAFPRTGRGGGSLRAGRRARRPGRVAPWCSTTLAIRPSGRCRASKPHRRKSPCARRPRAHRSAGGPSAARRSARALSRRAARPSAGRWCRPSRTPAPATPPLGTPPRRRADVGPFPVPARPVRHAQPRRRSAARTRCAAHGRAACPPRAPASAAWSPASRSAATGATPVPSFPAALGGDGHDVLLELADLPGGHPPTLEREQIAALGALHPRQQTRRLLGGKPAGCGLEHERAGAREADRRALLAQLREHHLAALSPSAPRRRGHDHFAPRAGCRRRARSRAPGRARPTPRATGSGSRSWSLACRVSLASTASAPPCSRIPSSRSSSARASATSRERGDITSHRALGHALHLEVAAPVAGAGADRPACSDERVGDLSTEQRAALKGGVVAKPLPRIRRHQLPIRPHDADHQVVDVQLRRRRPIAPCPPRGHMQRRGDRRARRRLADSRRRPSRGGERPPCCAPCTAPSAPPPRSAPSRSVSRSPLVGHRPQDRDRLRHRHRHLHVRDPDHPLDHGSAARSSSSVSPCSSRASRFSAPGRRSCSPVSTCWPCSTAIRSSRSIACPRRTPNCASASSAPSHSDDEPRPERARGPARRAGSRCGRTPPARPRAPAGSRRRAPRRRGCRPRPRPSRASAPIRQFISEWTHGSPSVAPGPDGVRLVWCD